MLRPVPFILFAIAGLAFTSGCSSGGRSGTEFTRADEFLEVANMLRDFGAAVNRGPKNAGELVRYQNDYPRGQKGVASGDIVVVWGVTMSGEGGQGTDAVVAYDKQTPTEGGYVLLHNGTVKKMTADEFKAAKMAK